VPQSILARADELIAFRYLIEKFGFDKGRLISEFPRRWFLEVYNATAGFRDVQKKRVEVALNQARKNKVVRCHRMTLMQGIGCIMP
jgi:hypothetical protein